MADHSQPIPNAVTELILHEAVAWCAPIGAPGSGRYMLSFQAGGQRISVPLDDQGREGVMESLANPARPGVPRVDVPGMVLPPGIIPGAAVPAPRNGHGGR